jgi:hypothetical protein
MYYVGQNKIGMYPNLGNLEPRLKLGI